MGLTLPLLYLCTYLLIYLPEKVFKPYPQGFIIDSVAKES